MVLAGTARGMGWDMPYNSIHKNTAHPLCYGLVAAYCNSEARQIETGYQRGVNFHSPVGVIQHVPDAYDTNNPMVVAGRHGWMSGRVSNANLSWDFGPPLAQWAEKPEATYLCTAFVANFDTPTQGTTFQTVGGLTTNGTSQIAQVVASSANGTGNNMRAYMYATDSTDVNAVVTGKCIDNYIGYGSLGRMAIVGFRIRQTDYSVDHGTIQAISSFVSPASWAVSSPMANTKTPRLLNLWDGMGQLNAPYGVGVAYAWARALSDAEIFEVFRSPYWLWSAGPYDEIAIEDQSWQ